MDFLKSTCTKMKKIKMCRIKMDILKVHEPKQNLKQNLITFLNFKSYFLNLPANISPFTKKIAETYQQLCHNHQRTLHQYKAEERLASLNTPSVLALVLHSPECLWSQRSHLMTSIFELRCWRIHIVGSLLIPS